MELCITTNIATKKRRYFANGVRVSFSTYRAITLLADRSGTYYSKRNATHTWDYKSVSCELGWHKFFGADAKFITR